MKSRLVLAVLAAALVFGALGYHYGKIRQQADESFGYAAGQRAPARGGPPAVGAQFVACGKRVLVTFDPATPGANAKLTVDQKPIMVRFPTSQPGAWALCWDLQINGDDPEPLTSLKLRWVRNNVGATNLPVLQCVPGTCEFLPTGALKTIFHDTPKGPRPNPGLEWQRIEYKLEGILSGGGQLDYDPDIVIKG